MFRYLCIFMLFSLISQSDVKFGSEEEHILEYMYTFFNSSHYEVVGLLDGEPVDFYSSVLKTPVPKKIWNEKERSFGNHYWQDHITSRQKIDKWGLSRAEDLKMHMTKNKSGGIVQMRFGCKNIPERKPVHDEETLFAEFAYDGETTMNFIQNTNKWTPVDFAAQLIINNWNRKRSIKYQITNFLYVECYQALYNFQKFELNATQYNNLSDPLIYTVPRGSLKPGHNNLTCLVTGTYPSSSPIEMNLFRNNVNLTEMEGVRSSGVRPNEDNTYQLRKTVMINASESEVYQCVVNHKSFPGTRKNTWEVKKHSEVKSQVEGLNPAYIGLFVFLLAVLLVVVWFFKNRWRSEPNSNLAANPEENAALGVQDGGSLIDQGGETTSVDLSSEREVLTNAPDAEAENDEAYGSRGSSDSDLSQIQ
ncbi:zinc-alpha-2-glycoprotein-like isoform X1 [Oncorhynchus masou masou]|uniref:zinc-alpha-2-glycoprotein-like isoform X1 n=1 Tax=Oncorhynchus masou masou TaxID=90313 RepID=UPI003183183D